MAASAGYLFPLAIIAYGVAMMRDSGWPGWLGVVLGVVSLVVSHFAISLGPVPNLLGYVNDVWYGILGMLFMGRGGWPSSRAHCKIALARKASMSPISRGASDRRTSPSGVRT